MTNSKKSSTNPSSKPLPTVSIRPKRSCQIKPPPAPYTLPAVKPPSTPTKPPKAWSALEDSRLIDSISRMGEKWALVCAGFPGRKPQECLERYLYLRSISHPLLSMKVLPARSENEEVENSVALKLPQNSIPFPTRQDSVPLFVDESVPVSIPKSNENKRRYRPKHDNFFNMTPEVKNDDFENEVFDFVMGDDDDKENVKIEPTSPAVEVKSEKVREGPFSMYDGLPDNEIELLFQDYLNRTQTELSKRKELSKMNIRFKRVMLEQNSQNPGVLSALSNDSSQKKNTPKLNDRSKTKTQDFVTAGIKNKSASIPNSAVYSDVLGSNFSDWDSVVNAYQPQYNFASIPSSDPLDALFQSNLTLAQNAGSEIDLNQNMFNFEDLLKESQNQNLPQSDTTMFDDFLSLLNTEPSVSNALPMDPFELLSSSVGNTAASNSKTDATVMQDDDNIAIPKYELDVLFNEHIQEIPEAEKQIIMPTPYTPVWEFGPKESFSKHQVAELTEQLKRCEQLLVQNFMITREVSADPVESGFIEDQLRILGNISALPYSLMPKAKEEASALETVKKITIKHNSASSKAFVKGYGTLPKVTRVNNKAVKPPPIKLSETQEKVQKTFATSFYEDLKPSIVKVSKLTLNFSPTEDELLLLGLQLFSANQLDTIRAVCLPTKYSAQLSRRIMRLSERSRASNELKSFVLNPFKPLSLLDKDLLRAGISAYGKVFRSHAYRIFNHFPRPLIHNAWEMMINLQEVKSTWIDDATSAKDAKSALSKILKKSKKEDRLSQPPQSSTYYILPSEDSKDMETIRERSIEKENTVHDLSFDLSNPTYDFSKATPPALGDIFSELDFLDPQLDTNHTTNANIEDISKLLDLDDFPETNFGHNRSKSAGERVIGKGDPLADENDGFLFSSAPSTPTRRGTKNQHLSASLNLEDRPEPQSPLRGRDSNGKGKSLMDLNEDHDVLRSEPRTNYSRKCKKTLKEEADRKIRQSRGLLNTAASPTRQKIPIPTRRSGPKYKPSSIPSAKQNPALLFKMMKSSELPKPNIPIYNLRSAAKQLNQTEIVTSPPRIRTRSTEIVTRSQAQLAKQAEILEEKEENDSMSTSSFASSPTALMVTPKKSSTAANINTGNSLPGQTSETSSMFARLEKALTMLNNVNTTPECRNAASTLIQSTSEFIKNMEVAAEALARANNVAAMAFPVQNTAPSTLSESALKRKYQGTEWE